ncbi:hypothetical protein AMS68_002253 [Peltaster fructicola]|uniref:Major facilitator superfamily (MFS) profile domain-containing protein n=1 Tax=Peltaster fructicola TaxID=286661 RepID=A0A6H0XPX3_9PEZI|nr:hypothetical protein AMS68_002253 [Peltaster fructicola]
MTDSIQLVELQSITVSAETHSPTTAMQNLSAQVELEDVASPRSRLRLWMIVIALNAVLFISALDQTIVATTIPAITADLQSAAGYTWIGGAYLLASAVSGPIWTKTSDIWGRKPILLVSVLTFAAASLIAALSIDINMLIAARGLQGTAAGGLAQLVAISTSDIFSLRERALFFGLQGGVYAVAGSAGPLIGGALAQYVSWRWCFWINLPICGLAFILLLLLLDTHNPRTPLTVGLKAIDWHGTITMLAMSLLFLLGLNFGGSIFPWNSATVISLIVLGTAGIGVFLYVESAVARYPLMPLSVFKHVSNNMVVLLAVGHSMINTGVEFYLPLYFQSVKQKSPLMSGLLLLPLMVVAAVTDILTGIAIHKTGRYIDLLRTGAVLMTIGTGLYISLESDTPIAHIIGFEVVSGTGVALLYQAPMLAIHNFVKQPDVAAATASLGFLRTIASAVSIVVGGVLFQNGMNEQQMNLQTAGLDQTALHAFSGDHAAASFDAVALITDIAQLKVILSAYAWSIRNIFILYACIGGLTMIASLFVKQGHMSEVHVETKTGIAHMTPRDNKE